MDPDVSCNLVLAPRGNATVCLSKASPVISPLGLPLLQCSAGCRAHALLSPVPSAHSTSHARAFPYPAFSGMS